MTFSIVILAVSLSIDAFGVGIAYGIRRVRIPFVSKCLICLFSIIYSGLSLMLGSTLSDILPLWLSKSIGIGILITMGIWIAAQALLKNDSGESINNTFESSATLFELAIKSLGITIQVIKNPARGDIDKSGYIDIGESFLLGLALSIDAIGVGIGSALSGFHSIFIPIAVGLFQLIFLYSGTYIGERFSMLSKLNKKIISVIPGILLVFIALMRI